MYTPPPSRRSESRGIVRVGVFEPGAQFVACIRVPGLQPAFRFGETRAGGETTGILSSGYTSLRGFDTIQGVSTGTARIIPVHTIDEELAWSKGAHDFKFGGQLRFISNQSTTYSHSYNTAVTNVSGLSGSGADITPASLGILAGVPYSRLDPHAGLDDVLLLACTETTSSQDIAALSAALKRRLGQ